MSPRTAETSRFDDWRSNKQSVLYLFLSLAHLFLTLAHCWQSIKVIARPPHRKRPKKGRERARKSVEQSTDLLCGGGGQGRTDGVTNGLLRNAPTDGGGGAAAAAGRQLTDEDKRAMAP